MEAEGARSFQGGGDAYDLFMGRYSRHLAHPFADAASVTAGQRVLDVGCGPGALTAELVQRVGTAGVAAIDPAPSFVEACASRFPNVQVQLGRAELLPFPDESFDRVMAQLVVHFVSEPDQMAAEFRRVLRPGGVAAACVWDFAEGMQMLRAFWDAALAIDRAAPDEAVMLRFGGAGEIVELFDAAGLVDVTESVLEVESTYSDFDELWAGFMAGIGPAGSFVVSLDPDRRDAVRNALFVRLGSPSGGFTLGATARCATGVRSRT
jgi:ubiquinone/menaquinone biosynthesis C-methylase UbiE